jgi:hypothetical protein
LCAIDLISHEVNVHDRTGREGNEMSRWEKYFVQQQMTC